LVVEAGDAKIKTVRNVDYVIDEDGNKIRTRMSLDMRRSSIQGMRVMSAMIRARRTYIDEYVARFNAMSSEDFENMTRTWALHQRKVAEGVGYDWTVSCGYWRK